MLKVGITGQAGFIGTHLYNTFHTRNEDFEVVPFADEFFSDFDKLAGFVASCDVIVHLAAVNRHPDSQVIYETNLNLVKALIKALEFTGSKAHILFSSSTQEEKDNPYGKSKSEGRILFQEWSEKNNSRFTGLIIPNVFGPFGRPYYNSVVATFCHQLLNGETPRIDVDARMKLIYVQELAEVFISHILNPCMQDSSAVKVSHTTEMSVTELLTLLQGFKTEYIEKGIFPNLENHSERNLFNTLVCYLDFEKHYPVKLKLNTDERGSFVETVKLKAGGQVSFSTTKPGITRGNHFHTRKAERFAVIKGKARIQLRRIGTDKVMNFELSGDAPAYVDMPVWHTHNITNTGDEDLYTIFWISEFFDSQDPDTFFEVV
jgi:UDP-2-acetamido-2,6-beta-L-arabino-hexul-4-ose reductase